MKEHLVSCGPADINGLIAELDDLNERMYHVYEDAFETDDEDVKAVAMRSWNRLDAKRDKLLEALNDALEYLRV